MRVATPTMEVEGAQDVLTQGIQLHAIVAVAFGKVGCLTKPKQGDHDLAHYLLPLCCLQQASTLPASTCNEPLRVNYMLQSTSEHVRPSKQQANSELTEHIVTW